MKLVQHLDLNVLFISIEIFILAGLGLTYLLRKRLNEKQFRAMVAYELLALTLIPMGFVLMYPDSWASGLVFLAMILFDIIGLIEFLSGNKPDKDK